MAFVDPFMAREQIGTSTEDVLISGLGNDTLVGLEGNDTLFGGYGENVLIGGPGDDLLIDGLGDDVLAGGADNDVLRSSAGDDTMEGGSGNDLFYVAGALPGGHVLISDRSGDDDVLDARGATTSALIDLNPGGISYVDGRSIEIEGGDTVTRPLDLLLLQDLSGSYSDDLAQMRALIGDLVSSISSIAPDAWLGAASFVDKPTSPFGGSGDYEYMTDLPLTSDFAAFTSIVNNWSTLFGGDYAESQLSGLLQIAERAAEIGWRSDSVKIVVLTTDAPYHAAGDFTSVPPNDGDDVLDGTPPGTGEDYPSVEQVRDALEALNIIPIFAVTSDVTTDYEGLVSELGFGAVVPLAGDSSNIVDVFESAIEFSTNTIIERARGGEFDDTILGNDADNYLSGRGGDDSLRGEDGNDVLSGGDGNDRLFGNDDDDRLFGNDGDDLLAGGDGEDTLSGGNDDDVLYGNNDADSLSGGNGDDTISGGNGEDTISGGAGEDDIRGGVNADVISGGAHGDTLRGESGSDTISGDSGADVLSGSTGHDSLEGGSGDDRIFGGAHNDTIVGGLGQDTLTGNSGADVFVFNDVADSPLLVRDEITDFEDGIDMIDLSGIMPGLTFVAAYTGTAGEVRYNGTIGRLYIDTDGDSSSDFAIDITGAPVIDATDLIL